MTKEKPQNQLPGEWYRNGDFFVRGCAPGCANGELAKLADIIEKEWRVDTRHVLQELLPRLIAMSAEIANPADSPKLVIRRIEKRDSKFRRAKVPPGQIIRLSIPLEEPINLPTGTLFWSDVKKLLRIKLPERSRSFYEHPRRGRYTIACELLLEKY